ncbi:HAD-IA family hydrolase [Mucilaginibacter panaciglaebae]|uniref:HAD-IA family hydrolase n=1 Tax=Mucilaginibacter panaciglaebae TaxID=502331 RepID=A0ABP7WZE8_9SPHI
MEITSPSKYEKLLERSDKGYKAFLYDCDGTLADNMKAHALTYIKVAADQGVHINGEIIDELAGWPVPAVVKEINKRYGSNMDPEEFAEIRQKLYHDEYIAKITPVEHVVDHLKAHYGKVPIAVVSGGSREAVEKTLNVLGIADLVETLVCAGETPHGKPYPDPFLAAAVKLGVDPKHCLVFEDGDPGVQSAIAAGMDWVRIDQLD